MLIIVSTEQKLWRFRTNLFLLELRYIASQTGGTQSKKERKKVSHYAVIWKSSMTLQSIGITDKERFSRVKERGGEDRKNKREASR